MAITQGSSTNNPDKSQKNKRRFVASAWLIMALLTGAAALALWMFSSAPVFEEEKETEKEAPAEVLASNIEQVKHIDQLNELSEDVKPISFDALVRDLRDYPAEFKDAKYLKKNKGKWTVQVMDVSEHEIITDYLGSRDDRHKFAYFRYRDSNNQPRYLLTYDVMGNKQQANNASDSFDFGLPANVKVIPEEISDYLDVIENYELTGPVKDLSRNRTRQVKLQPTKRELAPRRSASQSQSTQTSDNNNERPASQSNNSSSQSSQPQAANTPIRDSSDTSDTLSVQEERKVVAPSSNDENAAPAQPKEPTKPKAEPTKPKAEPSKPATEPTKPKAEPTKPQEKQEKKPAEGNKNNQKPANSGEGDSIKQLIEQKSE